jgi:ferredoxin
MAFFITSECVGCGACEATCPVEAIVEAGEVFRITEECIECGACLGVCAVGAIVEIEEKEEDASGL